ncbi:MAG: hypothetical protein AMJ84_04380 [Acidithiobacillales bacterium SM23_46]|nr:MAG: hypothetical protein AMJ84_04380 [Acidithiobacillales bacterium SM23_46]
MHPLRDGAQHIGVVVAPRNDVGAGFDVDAATLGTGDGTEHLFDARRPANLLVEVVIETLDIGTEYIDVRGHERQGLFRHKTVRDVDCIETGIVRNLRNVEHVFEPHRRFGVSKGNALCIMALRCRYQILGRHVGSSRQAAGEFIERRDTPGNFQVMAAAATKIAAEGADRHHLRSGEEVLHRLAFNRAHVDGR